MYRNLIKTSRPGRGAKGFTLIEMLVVAALIVIFSSLAVINVSEYMKSGRTKAATAEARHIATAMAFAQQDLGFFPKICFLNLNLQSLTDMLQGMTYDAVEYHGHNIGDLGGRLNRNWKGQYMGINHEKVGKMHFISNGVTKSFDWPLDPWGTPYVAYLSEMTDQIIGNNQHQVRFITNAGSDPNYFAGVVSYGPNKVPGMKSDAKPADTAARNNLRLFRDQGITNPVAGYMNFRLPTEAEYQQPPLLTLGAEMIRLDMTPDPNNPRIREVGSDDRVYEF